jgi:citrate synthase
MNRRFSTEISTYEADSVKLAGLDLTEEVMGKLDFTSTTYLLLTGDVPTNGERVVLNGMLTSLIAHGVTPHAIVARLTHLTAPESIQGAIAAGILGTGNQFLGTMENCATALLRVTAPDGDLEEPDELAAEYVAAGRRFPGIGHPHHSPVDPRAERLFELAGQHDIAGENVEMLRSIRDRLETETKTELPINVTGAIGAISTDMGLSPKTARGIAILSRTVGLIAELSEEDQTPQAMGYWDLIQARTDYTPPDNE